MTPRSILEGVHMAIPLTSAVAVSAYTGPREKAHLPGSRSAPHCLTESLPCPSSIKSLLR